MAPGPSKLSNNEAFTWDGPSLGFISAYAALRPASSNGRCPFLHDGSHHQNNEGHSAPRDIVGARETPPTMARMMSTGSVNDGLDMFSAWSSSSSPPQGGLFHASPMMHPLSSQGASNLGAFDTSFTSQSLDEEMTRFSFGGLSSCPDITGDVEMSAERSIEMDSDDILTGQIDNSFLDPNMVHAIVTSADWRAQDTAALAFDLESSPLMLPEGSSLPMDGQFSQLISDAHEYSHSLPEAQLSMMHGHHHPLASTSSLDFPMHLDPTSPFVSPMQKPQDRGKRRRSSAPKPVSIIQVEADMELGGRMVPARNASGKKGNAPWRRGPLNDATRANAAKMRLLGACNTCKERKAKCDEGLYCRSCIRNRGVNVIHTPCRGRMLRDLAEGFMQRGIFPTARTLTSFLGTQHNVTKQIAMVLLNIGFGPPIPVEVRVVRAGPCENAYFQHTHTLYQWPLPAGEATPTEKRTHKVFPAVLASTEHLKITLIRHLENLVDNHFDQFPTHSSQLRVLIHFYRFYKSIPEDGEARPLLKEAFKLLVLVHIGGDFFVTPDSVSIEIVKHFFGVTGFGACPEKFETCPKGASNFPTPCFIRGQFGEVMPELANEMLVNILDRLELLALSQKCDTWASACVTFGLLLMTIESMDYHVRKVSYHDGLDTPQASGTGGTPSKPIPCSAQRQASPTINTPPDMATRSPSDEATEHFLGFYQACFPSCHKQHLLSANPSGRKRSNSVAAGHKEAQDTLIAELRQALGNARGYLMEKGTAVGDNTADLSFYFDRKLARFFMPSLEVSS